LSDNIASYFTGITERLERNGSEASLQMNCWKIAGTVQTWRGMVLHSICYIVLYMLTTNEMTQDCLLFEIVSNTFPHQFEFSDITTTREKRNMFTLHMMQLHAFAKVYEISPVCNKYNCTYSSYRWQARIGELREVSLLVGQ